MTVRHAVLPVAALLVLGVGVYLLVEVRARPALPPPAPRDRTSRPTRAEVTDVPQAAAPAREIAARKPQPPDPVPPRLVSPTPPVPVPAGSAQEPDAELVGPKLDAVMTEANKAYDRGDYEDAKLIASRLLAKYPTNVRMLRIMVSASCIDGDTPVAMTHYAKLPPPDQEQMKIRCARYGVTFPDKP